MSMNGSEYDDRYLVETSGRPLGMIIRDESGFVFHASAPEVWSLNCRVFESRTAAEQAVRAKNEGQVDHRYDACV
ncbi:MAG TPA: hypothetical protein VKN76_09500 [Kiloniellaceae bacterium]|nr:hypothetical protein [Kiloniellaceae bacterium]